MRSSLHSVLFVIALFFFNNTNAQWTQIPGPEGGRVNSLARVGNEIWAATGFGIYTSANEGVSWTKYPLINKYCSDIKYYNDTIAIAYYDIVSGFLSPDVNPMTVFSYDNGNTWNTPVQLSLGLDIEPLYFSKVGSNLIASFGNQVYITTDGGTSWQLVPDINGNYLEHVTSDNKHALARLNGSGVYDLYSTADGISWSLMDSTFDADDFQIQDSTILIYDTFIDSITYSFVARSADFGATWDTVVLIPALNWSELTYFNGTYYLNTHPGYYTSCDDGLNWNFAIPPFNYYPYLQRILLSNGDELSAIDLDGLVRYSPQTPSLIPSNTGLAVHNTTCLESNNGILYAGTIFSAYTSNDAGSTWNKIPFPFGVYDFAFKGDTVVGAEENVPGHICRSFNNGVTWDTVAAPVGTGWSDLPYLSILNDVVYSSSNKHIFYSNNWGLSWDTLNVPVIPAGTSCITLPAKISGIMISAFGKLYCQTADNYLAVFDPALQQWTEIHCGSYNPGTFNPTPFIKLDSVLVLRNETQVEWSADQGVTWNMCGLNGLPLDSSAFWPITPRNITLFNGFWVGNCSTYGVYVSNDQGNNWQPIQGNTPFYANQNLTVSNNTLYCGSYYQGIWKRTGALEVISGNVYFDNNNNGIKDPGELPVIQAIIKSNPANIFASTDSSGNFTLITDAIGDTLSVVPPVSFGTSTPSWYITNGAATNRDFGIYLTPNVINFSADIINANSFVPGFPAKIVATATNMGAYNQSSTITCVIDNKLQFISSVPAATSSSGDTLFFNIDSLSFMQSYPIAITVQTPPSLSIGDSIQCSALVLPFTGDIDTLNNRSAFSTQVLGSYDPNDKSCLQGNYFTPAQLTAGENLSYIVRFQNTGNFPAATVHARDSLSYYFDISTFRILSSSHPMHWSISEHGIVDFYFDNINLPPSSTNDLLSHGFVKYSIKPKEAVTEGDALINTSNIYFDFNSPINTNTTTTLVAYPPTVSVSEVNNQLAWQKVKVYPNPASQHIFIDLSAFKNDQYHLVIVNSMGTIVSKQNLKNELVSENLSMFTNGLYFGIITNAQDERITNFKFLVR